MENRNYHLGFGEHQMQVNSESVSRLRSHRFLSLACSAFRLDTLILRPACHKGHHRGFRDMTPTMENQVEKKMELEIETLALAHIKGV